MNTETDEGPRVSGAEMRDLGRLRRSSTDRYLGGVAGGLARHFDVDPTIIRVLFVVTSFFGGAGVLAYVALWLLVPDEADEHAAINLGGDARRTVIIVVAGVAVLVLLGNAWGGAWSGFWHFPWIVVALVLLAVLLATRRHRPLDNRPLDNRATDAGLPADPQAGPDDATMVVPVAPPARRPRRTGLVWFWPTLALIAIGLGTLAVVGAGHHLPPGSYAALALAIIGAALVAGAFVGRAGGLIALGVLTAIVLAVTTVVGQIGFDGHARDISPTPATAAAVQPSYSANAGRIRLDLSQVADPAALDGRTVDVSVNAGDIEVVVPRGVDVAVNADIRFVGGIHVDGESRTGGSPSLHTLLAGAPGAPHLTLDLHERVGQITVRQGAFQ
jgi:phage shock protein PspC (stress-responsive transcriptional regulator)